MAMKASSPNEDKIALVSGTEIYGVGAGVGGDHSYLTFGWDRHRLLTIVNENASVRLDWPKNDFFNVRVGSQPPFLSEGQRQSEEK